MKLNFITKIILFLLFLIFGFFDFISFLPETVRNDHLAEKFIINKARAATVSYSIPWASSVEGFVWVLESCNGTCTQGFTAADGNPAGSMFARIAGRNKKSAGYWKKSLTWEDMGVPAGATVTGVDGRFDVKLAQETNTAAHLAGLKIFDSTDAITVLSGSVADVETEFDPTSSSWITRNVDGAKTIDPAYQSSSTFVTIRMREDINSGNNAVASSEVRVDNIVFVITYTSPNATSFINNTEGALTDGGRSGQQITATGVDFGVGPSNGTTNAVKIGTYIVPNGNVTTWNPTTIVFMIPAAASIDGGAGTNGLIIRANGIDDITPLDFYIYPNITSASANSGQIGSEIAISGDHFGATAGLIVINAKTAAVVGAWNATSLTVRIPGQEGAININGKIRITRAGDSKTSNPYPAGNFTILSPSVSGSNPASASAGQIIAMEFAGFGIDTDAGAAPILKLTKADQSDIAGASYAKVADYQTISAIFDLTGAATGWWKLEIENMDTQSGSYGDESSYGFFISATAPNITGIAPSNGFDFEILSGISINGNNFDLNPTIKLTMAEETDIAPSTPFSRASANLLDSGAFDFTAKATGAWTVVVTNSDNKTGSYSGFIVDSAIANIYQFADNTDNAQPPASEVPEGGGIGNQSTIYFRLDMDSNKTSGETLYPQVEMQPLGMNFQCALSDCPELTTGFFAQESIPYSGITIRGWVGISDLTGADDNDYHWRIRLRNSSGKVGNWVDFGTLPHDTNTDLYLDNTPPSIAGECPAINISDTSATIDWNTSDIKSGSEPPPGVGTYATAQVEYKAGTISEDWNIPGNFSPALPEPREASPHAIIISGLLPGTNYVYRARSKDYFGNEGFSSNCAFPTSAAMPIKTIEMFIMQEEGFIENTQFYYPFTVIIPESNNNPISINSAIIEISGISGAAGNDQTVNVGFLRGNQTIGPSSGDDFTIESAADSSTPFTILFDALNPPGPDQENMSDLTIGGYANSKTYTLFLKGNAAPSIKIHIPNAKLILTYSHTP